jgi:hypothetical protein
MMLECAKFFLKRKINYLGGDHSESIFPPVRQGCLYEKPQAG